MFIIYIHVVDTISIIFIPNNRNMKKTIDTKPELVPQTVALVPEVQEQMKDIMKKLKEVQPVFQQLNSSLELVIRTAIGQAGFTMAEVKNLSLDEENWVLKFEK